MGKRRNTAKTGDKAIYKGRQEVSSSSKTRRRVIDDEVMYDAVDRFHNERDQEEFIRFGDAGNDSGDDDYNDKDLMGSKEAVLDLGVGGGASCSSTDDDDDDDDSSVEHRNTKGGTRGDSNDSSEFPSGSGSDSYSDSDEEDMKDLKEQLTAVSEDPRKWGNNKSMYYHGDTADLEIGQEEEDAFLEEEAAKEVQASRFKEMDEDDFVLSDNEEEPTKNAKNSSKSSNAETIKSSRDVSKLSRKEARKLLLKHHPELLPMISYFADVAKDLRDRTGVATKALMGDEGTAESVGTTLEGQQYLLTKALLQNAIALNGVLFLMLKSTAVANNDGNDSIQAHPITDQLKSLYGALEKLKTQVEMKAPGLCEQVDTLVKAAALIKGGVADDDDGGGGSGDDSSEGVPDDDDDASETEVVDHIHTGGDSSKDRKESKGGDEFHEDRTATGYVVDPQKHHQRTLNEARFGLRPDETTKSSKALKKRSSNFADDFGDLDEARSDVKVLASTVNSIEQRSQVASRKRRLAPITEHLDDLDEHDDRLAQGIKIMEEEMGKLDDETGDRDIASDDGEDGGFQDMENPGANDESLGFYESVAKKSTSKKAFKKSLYQVDQKFPRSDGLVDGERAISRTILKNRGLVAHKAKINRNPRVKKREQYRKALIRRKGAVRAVREGEFHAYGGEGTGIKSGISRSRKLTGK